MILNCRKIYCNKIYCNLEDAELISSIWLKSTFIFFLGKTLLPQYLGMYRLTVDNDETYLVVMRNVFSNHLKIHTKYDLKGSTVDREASQKEREKRKNFFFVICNLTKYFNQLLIFYFLNIRFLFLWWNVVLPMFQK